MKTKAYLVPTMVANSRAQDYSYDLIPHVTIAEAVTGGVVGGIVGKIAGNAIKAVIVVDAIPGPANPG